MWNHFQFDCIEDLNDPSEYLNDLRHYFNKNLKEEARGHINLLNHNVIEAYRIEFRLKLRKNVTEIEWWNNYVN